MYIIKLNEYLNKFNNDIDYIKNRFEEWIIFHSNYKVDIDIKYYTNIIHNNKSFDDIYINTHKYIICYCIIYKNNLIGLFTFDRLNKNHVNNLIFDNNISWFCLFKNLIKFSKNNDILVINNDADIFIHHPRIENIINKLNGDIIKIELNTYILHNYEIYTKEKKIEINKNEKILNRIYNINNNEYEYYIEHKKPIYRYYYIIPLKKYNCIFTDRIEIISNNISYITNILITQFNNSYRILFETPLLFSDENILVDIYINNDYINKDYIIKVKLSDLILNKSDRIYCNTENKLSYYYIYSIIIYKPNMNNILSINELLYDYIIKNIYIINDNIKLKKI